MAYPGVIRKDNPKPTAILCNLNMRHGIMVISYFANELDDGQAHVYLLCVLSVVPHNGQ